MQKHLTERIAVVSGASAGIGRACAVSFALGGAKVVVNARRKERLLEIEEQFNHRDAIVTSVCGDASDSATVDMMLEAARETFGRDADLVVVNAGRGLAGSVYSSDPSEWEQMIELNILGAAKLMRAASERMVAARAKEPWPGGRAYDLVIIGSTVGRHISPFSSMYGATKFAVNSLAEGLRRELAEKAVRVTLIEPGIVESEFQGVAGYDEEWKREYFERVGPVIQPDDVARAITFAVSQPAHVHINDIMIRPTKQNYP